MTIQSIETRYAGCRFRSRLEARHAVFFESVGIPWLYEPEGFVLPDGSWYLPDFLLYPDDERHRFWVEVKARTPGDDEIEKCRQLAVVTGVSTYLHFDPQFRAAPAQPGVTYMDFFDDVAWEEDNDGDVRYIEVPKPWKRQLSSTAFLLTKGMAPDHRHRPAPWWWTDCPHCGRIVLKLHGQVGWCPFLPDDEVDVETLIPSFRHRSHRLLGGYAAARSARFEYGECG